MSWLGKILGGVAGFSFGGPIGALVGAALGHQFFDKSAVNAGENNAESAVDNSKLAFFTATFWVMGHIAKADGRVTKDEVDMARDVMRQWELDSEDREFARSLFRQGRDDSNIALDEVLDQLRRQCRGSRILRVFLEIQVETAVIDGELHLPTTSPSRNRIGGDAQRAAAARKRTGKTERGPIDRRGLRPARAEKGLLAGGAQTRLPPDDEPLPPRQTGIEGPTGRDDAHRHRKNAQDQSRLRAPAPSAQHKVRFFADSPSSRSSHHLADKSPNTPGRRIDSIISARFAPHLVPFGIHSIKHRVFFGSPTGFIASTDPPPNARKAPLTPEKEGYSIIDETIYRVDIHPHKHPPTRQCVGRTA